MVSEAVEEVLNLVQNASQKFKSMIGTENAVVVHGIWKLILIFEKIFKYLWITSKKESKTPSPKSKDENATDSANQQQDWSILWSCFENPLSLLSTSGGLPKGMQVTFFIEWSFFQITLILITTVSNIKKKHNKGHGQ